MAETTATTSLPCCLLRTMRSATARMRSALATELPPYFWTTSMPSFYGSAPLWRIWLHFSRVADFGNTEPYQHRDRQRLQEDGSGEHLAIGARQLDCDPGEPGAGGRRQAAYNNGYARKRAELCVAKRLRLKQPVQRRKQT